MFVRPHGTSRLPLDGFSWNFIFEDFSKICRENSGFIKIVENEGYFTWTPINIFLSFLPLFFLEFEIFQSAVEDTKTYVLCSGQHPHPPNSASDHMIMWRGVCAFACWIPQATNTHSGCVILVTFPLQQRLHERSSLLPYMCIACLVYFHVMLLTLWEILQLFSDQMTAQKLPFLAVEFVSMGRLVVTEFLVHIVVRSYYEYWILLIIIIM
jgi:hypothetical protein